MIKKSKFKSILLVALSLVLIFSNINNIRAAEAAPIKLVVDGSDITYQSAPIIENDRTLVPVRFVTEALGATVSWDGVNRTVMIERGSRKLFLKIGSYLVSYDDGASFTISDVAPKIINDRTYVPIRLVSNAFGIGIEWDGDTRTVHVDSSKTSVVQPFFDMNITSHSDGSIINGETTVSIVVDSKLMEKATEVRILLLDTSTFRGFVIARGKATDTDFNFLPDPGDNGDKILVAALYDNSGTFIGGDSTAVVIQITPEVSVTGLSQYQVIKDNVQIVPKFNFQTAYIDYEIENTRTGYTKTKKEQDPSGSYSWTPVYEQNGINLLRVTAYDSNGNSYESPPLSVISSVKRELSLAGVWQGMTIDRAVTLYASRNYDVDDTHFLIRDVETGKISVLGKIPYGGFTWFPGPDEAGEKDLFVRVKDTSGIYHQSKPVRVIVDGSPKVQLKGIGPSQVVSTSTVLSIKSNIEPDRLSYKLTEKATGSESYLHPDTDTTGKASLFASAFPEGDYIIHAEAYYQGSLITSSKVNFSIFNGKTYGPIPVTTKDQFLNFASEMAVASLDKTGMSAALQTSQAILETGWGQSVPVDKYTGKFSNNLFGIKGAGSNGSVVSNTWEVFNGVTYRIDANFRAYSSINEGWDDHKGFLLALSRYETFRSVMYDSMEGAWALKRAGYATDPLYAVKLIKIITRYNLNELDETGL